MDIKLQNGNRITSIDSSESKRSSRDYEAFKNVKFENIIIDRVENIRIINQEDSVKLNKMWYTKNPWFYWVFQGSISWRN